MSKYFYHIILLILIIATAGFGQQVGQWGMSVQGDFSKPIAGLSEWFVSAPGIGLSLGQQYNEKWFIEGKIELNRFDKENLSGYPAGNLDLSLEHVGIIVNGRYRLGAISKVKPYFNLAGGVYWWRGVRGEVQPDSTVSPYVPFIEEKKLEEMNWGFSAGLGAEIWLLPSLSLDALAYYRFIIGDLWPTLQPNIELEGVSGFQTINLALGLRYYF